tara:strand:- start:16038 stop:16514 length:477 start_codon:yes stop_codon:yes gene_type:complete
MAQYPLLPIKALELLEKEFKLFLASFEIDKDEWIAMKRDDEQKADGIVAAFSDWVWTNVLQKAEYLTKREDKALYFFKLGHKSIQLMVVHANDTYEGLPLNQLSDEDIVFELDFKRLVVQYSSKDFEGAAVNEVYKLIMAGCEMTDGAAFKSIALKLS